MCLWIILVYANKHGWTLCSSFKNGPYLRFYIIIITGERGVIIINIIFVNLHDLYK